MLITDEQQSTELSDSKSPARLDGRRFFKAQLLLTGALLLVADLVAGWLLVPPPLNAFRTPHHYYHHGLLPNQVAADRWGDRDYPVYTNSLGLRDARVREIPLIVGRPRILLLGDSFIEGQGVAYEESVPGLLQDMLGEGRADVLNAGVVSYSPRLYYLKTRYLLEQVQMKFDELIVFIDISDMQNEIVYQHFSPADIGMLPMFRYQVDKFLRHRSFMYYSFRRFAGRDHLPDFGSRIFDNQFSALNAKDREVASNFYDMDYLAAWTFDEKLYRAYGEKGVRLALGNMRLLAALCREHGIRLRVVVYPWPPQLFMGDRDSIQVKIWQRFCNDEGADFINLFPEFMGEQPVSEVIRNYFIEGDVHWNRAGHRLVATVLERRIAGR